MMKQIQLPCGLNEEGKLIYIDEVKNGFDCKCICPGCKQPLVAKNGGKKREHHFAHYSSIECEHGYQSALHYMAKDLFLEMQYLMFVKNGSPVQYKMDSVELEQQLDEIIPDILVTCDGKKFIVEIYVTHAVDDEKKTKIKDMQVSAIEIDISRFHKEMIDKETLRQELCNTENFSWIYDADFDLIEQKKEIIQKFGLKLPIQEIGNAIGCPILANQKNEFARFVTSDFCFHCPNCVYQNGQNFISCGKLIPISVSFEIRRKLYSNVFVNTRKVMFANEFNEYNKNFLKNLESAMQMQYRIFQNISNNMFVMDFYSQQPSSLNRYGRRSYHRNWWL